MQGTVVKVLVQEGDTVREGDTLVVLEAMKMENIITADRAGAVSELLVTVGESVGAGDILVVIA